MNEVTLIFPHGQTKAMYDEENATFTITDFDKSIADDTSVVNILFNERSRGILQNMTIVYLNQNGSETTFTFKKNPTEEELALEKNRSDIEYLAMMSDIDLDEGE